MSGDDAMHAIRALAGSMQDLERRAAQQYLPIVEDILRTGSRDAQHIEQTLDGLLDFCGHEPVLQLYKKLCRHYMDIDPVGTVYYINAYREQWDNDGPEGQP